MVGAAGEGPSAGGGSASASASASDVLASSSLPRSFSYGTDGEGLETGRRNSRNALLDPGSRINSRDSLLDSGRSSGMEALFVCFYCMVFALYFYLHIRDQEL